MKEHHGLAKQFIRIIALAALESVLLLTLSQVVLAKGLRFWFSRTEVQQHATQKQVQELQSYVTEHHLATTDVKELTDWSHKRRYTLLELYRGQTMIYSSFAPKDGMISFLPQNGTLDQNPGVLVDKTGFYDWLPCYTLTFADGEVSAMLYYNGFNTYYGTGCEILLSLCILWWFPSLFLLHCRRIVRYVVQLSEEIQAMEGGDLDHPITIRGSDEITTLASCLDSMRVTLRQQQEEEGHQKQQPEHAEQRPDAPQSPIRSDGQRVRDQREEQSDKRREEQAGQKGPAETDAALAADDADQHRKKTARHQAEKEREQRHIRFD